MKRAVLALAALIALGTSSQGAQLPQPGGGDNRIYSVTYDPAEVVELHGVLGYQTLIEFAPDERIENVAIGDSLGWQVTPNRKANLLFVKPMDTVPPTNMTVVTNLRQYAFSLTVPKTRSDVVYVLRFDYPKPPPVTTAPAAPAIPQAVNNAYSYDGSDKNLPLRIFDDGKATYFQFRDGEDYPALFVIEADKGEAVVNSHLRAGYLVVDLVARGFILRRGDEVTKVYNDGFREPLAGPLAPKKRTTQNTCWIFCR